MNTRILWSRILVIAGSIAMLIGAIDPLEGSLIILAGSGLVTLGTHLGKSQRRILLYWVWVFALITVGVGIIWVLSAFGGLGGTTGRSLWWGLVILPYPIGWIMGIISLIVRLIEFLKSRKQRVQSA
jgi:purine-cytosine permease-like protein